jgi:hypothetical protein
MWFHSFDTNGCCGQYGSSDETERCSNSESDSIFISNAYNNNISNANTYRDSYRNFYTNWNSYDYGHTYSDSVYRGDHVEYGIKYAHSFTNPFSQLFTDSHVSSDT